jgi:predicted thioesterase
MKTGLKPGQINEVEVEVTSDMRAYFPDEDVHDLYSTATLMHHMEWVARRLIRPYLDEHEEAVGCQVKLSHLKPTLVGMKVRIVGSVKKVRENRVICDVEAFNSLGKIAKGTVKQTIVNKSWLALKAKEMTLIDQLSKEAQLSREAQERASVG